MIKRRQWIEMIEEAWRQKSVVWLAGVRRSGKTCLCKTLSDTVYFDCELPRVRRMMDDPEEFLSAHEGRRIVLDEIHRLQNPSELLKIAADHFPQTRIIATGSSTLSASAKFRDTLTDRKRDIRMAPATLSDMRDFGINDMRRRFLHGGLPPFFLVKKIPERDFQGWMDDYWAKDIQELFRLEKKSSFQRFIELILAQSGGIFEATRFARPCEASRTTITNYLHVLEETLVAHIVRPFSMNRPTEIVSAPKVYGFDTGFMCYYRGWDSLRQEDMGLLWEHFVLNELQASSQGLRLNYWRDKKGHEVDFIISRRGRGPTAIECKWSAGGFEDGGLQAFRRQYPRGDNLVVAHDVEHGFSRKHGTLHIKFLSLSALVKMISGD